VRAAWNHRFPHAPLEQQDVVLTVPASFDDGARALTLEAARMAQLPKEAGTVSTTSCCSSGACGKRWFQAARTCAR
jgi:hypothetical protein